MASKTERTIINAAGLAQGIVLVTFPAASTIFTDTERVRAVQHPVRGHVPAAGRAGHHHLAARRRAGPPDLHQARLPARPGLQHRRDGAAARQHAGQERPGRRVSDAPGGDRVPGRGVRPDRPGAEHLHLGLQPGQRRPLGADAERAARAGHGAGTGAGGHLRRPGLLVGPSDRIDGAARGAARWSACGCRCGPEPGPAPARRAGPDSRPGSGCMRRSPSATASARR